jgi:hypothetical protein
MRGVRCVGDESYFVFRQKLLGEGSVRRGVVMVKQPGLFSPKFGTTSSFVKTYYLLVILQYYSICYRLLEVLL